LSSQTFPHSSRACTSDEPQRDDELRISSTVFPTVLVGGLAGVVVAAVVELTAVVVAGGLSVVVAVVVVGPPSSVVYADPQ